MTSEEIRQKVNEIYTDIESYLDPSSFILNPKIQEYSNQLEEIRKECKHEFENGICKYCDQFKK